ncbi:MAG: redoxin family protein [Fimbriimonadaceae bacterium]|nr:redoxin family protein [Fimbriimonadaceae bacterium]
MKMFRAVGLLALAVAASVASAQTLKPGVAAPELTVSSWVKGEPVESLKRGIYVVEFWATWCGPCRTSIPHLTELAKKYEGKVKMIGVSVWEQGDDVPKQVRDFVTQMGDKMDYHVAMDSGTKMADGWMEAAQQGGIPTAFIVKDGVVQWIGHPMSMDEPLEQVVNGSFDLKASVEEFDAAMKAEAEYRKFAEELEGIRVQSATNRVEALNRLAQIEVGDDVQKKMMVGSVRLDILVAGPKDEFMGAVRAMTATSDERQLLGSFAMQVSSAPRNDKALGLEIIKEVMKSGEEKDPIVNYYASEIYAMHEMFADALKAAEAAFEVVKADEETYGPVNDGFGAMLTQKIALYKSKI